MRLRSTLILILLAACSGGSPTSPRINDVLDGRWADGNACLDLQHNATSNLRVGCGHGTISPINFRSDGTFDVDGTYRIEAGPVSTDPPPPAHYSGALRDSVLTMTVTPSVSTFPAATYHFKYSPNANCGPECV